MECNFERARAGDSSAKRQVVESLRPRITKMAGYYARCTGEDADDLLQEAWIGLLEALPALDTGIGTPEQYLIQRARWRLLDAVKRARVRRCAPLDVESAEIVPDHAAEIAVNEACVSEFAGRLKETQRVVLNYLLDGMTWRETGDAMGCTCANIAYHVKQIRRQFEEWSGDDNLHANPNNSLTPLHA